jgi:hypothetical protein
MSLSRLEWFFLFCLFFGLNVGNGLSQAMSSGEVGLSRIRSRAKLTFISIHNVVPEETSLTFALSTSP